MHRLRWVVVALVLVAACSDDGGEAAETSTTTTTADDTTTTTSEPETTTTLSREDELRRLVVDLLEKRTELLMNPDPNRITEWLSPNCPCWDVENGLLNEYATNGWHLDGPDHEVLGVELTTDSGSAHDFTVVWRGLETNVVDGVGNVVRTRESFEPAGISVSIARDSAGGPLTVHDLLNLQLSPDVLAEVIAQGVP